ncbi:succinyl-diaminopimelate desuccinylase [Nitratiruptor sp. SB155-2]|uniref:Succinyl-diaminopimelate desuccinylase n=1 Tax=Nitratiruptor sp. (strain SB155-2) TaxID=387092 RepID=DAPE_NITSB|nr:succinyl-diaminopimelate desuccinylase [Nitratiruptor sp. SB155-2]A6Q4D7.1 RecName: Full=Succinyl-diaminopimelate desuccinylase; Short=SDAP desuccinylase; AltName: Full=N-succinyl-LL-2,6-diaminoheptanedioate amidohydrolase [Nitratiruptor sp. SB155-2]BAF70346.1 succinyl-diaminopimelate desuccinylase [Nitratiruptor sp. SB155-2]
MEVIDLFKKLLSFPSITPDDAGSLEFIREYLSDFHALWFNKHGVKNLFLYKKFGEGEHLCFAGHVDVVPPGDGWESDPFEPLEKDGFIYARGAQDMKSGVAAFVQAVKEAKVFHGTLSLLLTSDEEGEAKWGTKYALEELERMHMTPQYAIVAEPTCEERFGDAIKIGRRGSINGVIEKIGKQGHAAYPEKAVNPIHKVAQVLPKMAGVDLDSGDEYFAPSKFVITDIRAGMEVTNVTPGRLKMMFNVRNNTKTTMQDVERFVHRYFDGMNYTLKLSQSAKPFLTDPNSKVVQVIDQAIKKMTGITPKHSTAGGTSDARFFAEYGVKTIEFGVKNDTIHAPNERTSKEEVEKLYLVFKEVIRSF